MSLIHDFYIIESLGENDILDGNIFYKSLNSIGKLPIYQQVRNFSEFKTALENFENSQYKYLFISAHGDEEHIELSGEKINAYDLDDIKIDLDQRRIFMSTCRGGTYLFAKYFIKNGAYSVIGTPDDLDQIVAVGMWPTMLIIFERLSGTNLNFDELNLTLKKLAEVYQVTLHYYSFIRNKNEMKEYIYTGEDRTRSDYKI